MKHIASVLFVCTGNTCRSPMAEALFQHMLAHEKMADIRVFSRGVAAVLGRPAAKEAIEVLKSSGIDASRHRSKPLSEADAFDADLILVMEGEHRSLIQADYPVAADKTFLLKEYTHSVAEGSRDIQDPIGKSLQDYEQCKIEIQDCLLDLLSTLKEERKHREEHS